jgi:hypothetical protein
VAQLLDPGLADRDERDLRPGEDSIDQDEGEQDQDFGGDASS